MAALSDDALIRLAASQLSFGTYYTTVPKPYLDELKKHLIVNPHDTEFQIIPQQGSGFGVLKCLEEGCGGVQIQLTSRVGGDGGKEDGIGSLVEFRKHINQHATHKQARLRRIKASSGTQRSRTTTSSSSSSSAQTPPVVSASKPRTSLMNVLEGSTARSSKMGTHSSVKKENDEVRLSQPKCAPLPSIAAQAEPVEPTIPRKRLADALLGANAKKPKVEETRTPLASVQVDSLLNNSASMPRSAPPAPATALNSFAQEPLLTAAAPPPVVPTVPTPPQATLATRLEAARLQLQQLDVNINYKKLELSHLQRKKKKLARETRAISALQKEVRVLNNQRGGIENQILVLGAQLAAAAARAPPLDSAPSVQATSPHQAMPQTGLSWYGHVPGIPTLPTAQPVAGPSTSKALQAPTIQAPAKPLRPSAHGADLNPETSLAAVGALVMGKGYSSDDDSEADERPDFDINYPNLARIPSLFRGPVSSPQEFNAFIKAASHTEFFDENLTVQDSLKKLKLASVADKLPGMEISLMAHQVIGVAWMVDKEIGHFKGGCMSDEMGLGKTVQLIATTVLNRSDDPGVKTTLIIAPLALLDQWTREIETKTDLGLKCFIYHGSNKPKKKIDLQKFDYVLTTYGTLALEWPDPEEELRRPKQKRRSDDFIDESDSDAGRSKKKKQEPGVLIRMKWFRVVLDEAQNIRNRRTRISRAVTTLDTTYRWCLTGTPITNTLADAYGLLRFLQVRPWYDWQEFNPLIARIEKKNPDLASQRLQSIFAAVLLRRRKDTMMGGKPLIELPEKTTILERLEFSQEERDIYNAVEARAQAQFNRYLRAGTVLKNYAQVLVMLLRLRQICAHPSLIAEDAFSAALIAPDEVDAQDLPQSKRDILQMARIRVGSEFVKTVKKKLLDIVLARIAAEKQSMDAAIEDDECPVCYDAYSDPVITSCQHVFCRECANNVLNTAHVEDANEPNKYKANERPCPSCRTPFAKDKLFSRDAFMPTDADIRAASVGDVKMEEASDEDVKPNVKHQDDIVKPEDSDDEEMPTIGSLLAKGKAKAEPGTIKKRSMPKRKKRAARMVLDSSEEEEDDDDDDDMSDFIVQDDEDEDEKDLRRAEKKRRLRKRYGSSPAGSEAEESDAERDEEEDDGIIFGARAAPVPAENIKLTPRFLPSAKMKHMMLLLEQWSETHPDEKVLVISQWTTCLELVSDYLKEKGIGHVKYQGDMNRQQRDQAIRAFMAKHKAQIMLMSLRCGGVGLNLTRANRVISLDLAWSAAVENQAFDRVHRLGQNRAVEVHRLVIENTVEDRVLDLQLRKSALADGSLGEGTGKKNGRLTVRDLARLFGIRSE